MEPWTGLIALAISAALGIKALVEWIREKSLFEANTAERRDSVVVESAEKAVESAEKALAISERILTYALNDNESLRNRVRDLEETVERLTAQIERKDSE